MIVSCQVIIWTNAKGKIQWNVNRNTIIVIIVHRLKNVVCKMAAIYIPNNILCMSTKGCIGIHLLAYHTVSFSLYVALPETTEQVLNVPVFSVESVPVN